MKSLSKFISIKFLKNQSIQCLLIFLCIVCSHAVFAQSDYSDTKNNTERKEALNKKLRNIESEISKAFRDWEWNRNSSFASSREEADDAFLRAGQLENKKERLKSKICFLSLDEKDFSWEEYKREKRKIIESRLDTLNNDLKRVKRDYDWNKNSSFESSKLDAKKLAVKADALKNEIARLEIEEEDSY